MIPAAEHFRSLFDSLAGLLASHFRLLRVELASDAKIVGTEAGKMVAFAPLLLVGYGFLCGALAVFLHRFIAFDLSLLSVGAINLIVGGAGIYAGLQRLKAHGILRQTATEVERTVALSTELAAPRLLEGE